ncbi:glycosyltransferase family 2 protein [Hyphomicrobium sp.]|uniref:glycosyltransferase family 2 protein n=1 Tax=Hyphomicrobium sp. TaxID=82 RepID=UPI002FDCA733
MSTDLNQKATVSVVLVNYCTRDLTLACLSSLAGEIAACPGSEVIVVDNNSPDGSGAEIAAGIAANGWGGWARLLAMPHNGGFSYGNNGAIRELLARAAPPDYVWLLNTDTIVRPGALGTLVDFLDAHPDVGAAGSRLEHEDGTRQCSAFRFHSIAGELDSSLRLGIVARLLKRWKVAPPLTDEPSRYDWLSGASLLIRTQVFQDIGLMDEGYFLYYEETDFCRRAVRAGWSHWYVPQSRVVHLVGQSTGVTHAGKQRNRRASYWFQSRRRYFIKHHGVAYAMLADAALAVGTALSMVADSIRGRAPSNPERFLRDLARESVVFNHKIDPV